MEETGRSDDADMWIFFNVSPTEEMTVDMMVKDCRSGLFFSRQNFKLYRPYPGKKEQIARSALDVLKNRFLKELATAVKRRYLDGTAGQHGQNI
jgi:hypothetical protein